MLLSARLGRSLGLDAARGVGVQAVSAGNPAARAGLRRGDVIVGLGGKPVATVADLHRLLNRGAILAELPLAVIRDGARVTLGVLPEEAPLAA